MHIHVLKKKLLLAELVQQYRKNKMHNLLRKTETDITGFLNAVYSSQIYADIWGCKFPLGSDIGTQLSSTLHKNVWALQKAFYVS